jgi:hypothetical protein
MVMSHIMQYNIKSCVCNVIQVKRKKICHSLTIFTAVGAREDNNIHMCIFTVKAGPVTQSIFLTQLFAVEMDRTPAPIKCH